MPPPWPLTGSTSRRAPRNETGNAAFEAFGKLDGISEGMLSGIGRAARVLRIVIQFANTKAKVRAEQGMVHKPSSGDGDGHGTRHAWFTASAGVGPRGLEGCERSLEREEARSNEIPRQCFGVLERPARQRLREIADVTESRPVQCGIRPKTRLRAASTPTRHRAGYRRPGCAAPGFGPCPQRRPYNAGPFPNPWRP